MFCGTEGVEGNVHASRAWKGNDKPRCVSSRAFPSSFPRTSKQSRFSPSLFALRRIAESKEPLGEKRRANERTACFSPTNSDGASAICGSPSPTAATTGASIAARAITARNSPRCRLPITCAWRASLSGSASPRSGSPAASRCCARAWSKWCASWAACAPSKAIRSTSPSPPTDICWPRWRSRWPMPA